MRFLMANGRDEFEFTFKPIHRYLVMKPGLVSCNECDWSMKGDETKKRDGQYTDQMVLINTYEKHARSDHNLI